MTQVVTVQTDFVDLNQMTHGLMERVHETHVILTGPDGIDEGEWVQFAVNLQDGTAGFAGLGRCVRSVDNGDARLAHQRYDLVLDSLQFDQHGQDVYQYILMSRQALQSGEDVSAYDDGYAEDDAFDVGAAAVDVESVAPEAPASMDVAMSMNDDEEEEATRIQSSQDFAAGLAATSTAANDTSFEADFAPEFASEPPMSVDSSETAQDVVAPDPTLRAQAWDGDPSAAEMDQGEFGAAPEPLHPPAAGLHPGERRFVYANGLPLPKAPPRPDIDPSLRVTPAPRPQTASSTSHSTGDGVDPFEARADPAEEANGVVNGSHSVPPGYDDVEDRPARDAQDEAADSTYPGP